MKCSAPQLYFRIYKTLAAVKTTSFVFNVELKKLLDKHTTPLFWFVFNDILRNLNT